MLRVIPRYLEGLKPDEDRTRRMFASMGVSSAAVQQHDGQGVILRLRDTEGTARRLVASQLLDLLVRLQPLVASVRVDSAAAREVLGDLPDRFPVEVTAETGSHAEGLVVDIGQSQGGADLVVDGAGWCLSIDGQFEVPDDANPVGPMAAAAIGAGEVFKHLFRRAHPSEPLSSRFIFHQGCFSLFDYSASPTSPLLAERISVDGLVLGAGGVGAGVFAVLAALRERLLGRLVLVDDDTLDMYNLNRVTYARIADAQAERLKVAAAAEYLTARLPNCEVMGEPLVYKTYALRWNRRADRRFGLVLMGVDDDTIRWEVQRDLPRVLIDGSTGSHANSRMDRIGFGEAGCIGCARPPRPVPANPDPAECDTPPARFAPSISFNSAFAGVLVAAEALKAAMGSSDPVSFEHVFTYPLNADLAGVPGIDPRCQVACQDPLVRQAYRVKWQR